MAAANGKTQANVENGISSKNLLMEESEKDSLYISRQFTFFLFIEAIIILLFGLFVEYDEATEARENDTSGTFGSIYPMFQDIHVMVFIGFGFLMTFLRRYGYSAVGFTFLLGCFAFQWAILCRGFFESLLTNNWHRIPLRVETIVNADFCAASILISVGAVLGKLSPPQMIVMTFVEVIVYSFNEQIVIGQIRASDIGGSMTIHLFGAYFGLLVTKLMSRPKAPADNDDESSAYHADLFSMIGCVFLFLYWPSFNAALAGSNGNGQHRAVVNTILGITTSVIFVFFFSKILNGKFRMEDIQNATLAGGVALGASANMRTYAWGAMIVGAIAGVVSVVGFSKLNPWLKRNNYLRDTCGVNNLHGMPGLIGGLASIVFASMTSTADYGEYLNDGQFSISTRTPDQQAGFQMLAIVSTLLISITGGILCSGILKMTPFSRVHYEFQDSEFWEVPGREVPLYFSAPKTVETTM